MKPHKRSRRRLRTLYPVLKPGESIKGDRPECGLNRSIQVIKYNADGSVSDIKPPRTIMVGQFVYTREEPAAARSRYAPHIGKRQWMRGYVSRIAPTFRGADLGAIVKRHAP